MLQHSSKLGTLSGANDGGRQQFQDEAARYENDRRDMRGGILEAPAFPPASTGSRAASQCGLGDKQRADRFRGSGIMQRPEDAETVAAPDQLVCAAPSQRPQCRRDMVPSMNPRYNPVPEVDQPVTLCISVFFDVFLKSN